MAGAPPGMVFELATGTYSGEFLCKTRGTADKPIIFRPAAGAKVVIDGGLTVDVTSQFTRFEGIEFKYGGWTSRWSAQSNPSPSDIPLTKALTVNGYGTQIINCYIHDLAIVASNGAGVRWRGNIICRIGWDEVQRGHGHGIYAQNNGDECVFSGNIIFDCYGWGFHAYTQGGFINYLTCINNVCFNAGSPRRGRNNNILIGGYSTALYPVLIDNDTYGASGLNLGYAVEGGAAFVTMIKNFIPDGIIEVNVTYLVNEDNHAAPSTGQRVTVRPNEDAPHRASIAVYNEAEQDFMAVDVRDVLAPGVAYSLHYVQGEDDIVTGTVPPDGMINLDMRAAYHSVTAPIAGEQAGEMTLPRFGCFMIEAI